MIEMRRAQLSFGDGLIVEEVSDLREDWMKHADAVLSDEDIVVADGLIRLPIHQAAPSFRPPIELGRECRALRCSQVRATDRVSPCPSKPQGGRVIKGPRSVSF